MKAPAPPRSPWQLFYGGPCVAAAVVSRPGAGAAAAGDQRRQSALGAATAKTPLAAAVAAHRRDRGLACASCSRGYAGEGRGVRVVSVGGGPLLGPKVRATSRFCSP